MTFSLKKLFQTLMLAVAAAAGLMACATATGVNQRMKIATDPEGANIVVDGKIIGKTPSFVNVRRRKQKSITLEKLGYPPVTKDLNTSYRWGDSFFSNFVWLVYGQPIGAGIDLYTGAAWEYSPLGVVSLGSGMELPAKKKHPPASIAIAPPQTKYELLSDELAYDLERDMRKKFPETTVRPFDDTEKIFSSYSYTNSEKYDPADQDRLYEDLAVTHLLETTAEPDENGVTLHSRLVDIFTDREVQTFTERIPKQKLRNSPTGSTKEFMAEFINLMPNLFTFDIDSPSSDLQIKSGTANEQYRGVSDRSNANFLQLISSFGIRSVRSPHAMTGNKFVFRFVPALSFMYDRFHFEKSDPNPLQPYTFDWFTALGGVGPEFGLDTKVGYFYLDVIPCYSLNWITGSGGGREASSRTSEITVLAEFGYQIFASEHMNVRLFVRDFGIPPDAFADLLPELSGQPAQVDSASRGVAGLSIGYYFPETRTYVKNTFF